MLLIGTILLVSVATVMTASSFMVEDFFERATTGGASFFLWFAAAASSPEISIAYQKVVENTTDNSMTLIETGTHSVGGAVSVLSWVWLGMAVLSGIYLFYITTEIAYEMLKGEG